jgi:tetrahydromethanopterin S-methyltransferase subunit F
MICRLCGKYVSGTSCSYCCASIAENNLVVNNLISSEIGEIANTIPISNNVNIQTVQNTFEQPTNNSETVTSNKEKNNGFAIAGFVMALIGYLFIFGIIFSIIGLVKSREMNGKGKGFAIAGIVISILTMIYFLIVICLDFGMFNIV